MIACISKLKFLEEWKSYSVSKKGALRNEFEHDKDLAMFKRTKIKNLELGFCVSGEW